MKKEIFGMARKPEELSVSAELVVVGGGLSGTCAAITAARQGIKVILIQDRPVLGGNSSSEVRLWILGATSHMGNNNRWAREGGVIDEILVENMYRNREGNSVIFDTILLEKVVMESNISLFLNTSVFDVVKSDEKTITQVDAFCSQNSTRYKFSGKWFIDASGDGIVAFGAGAPFRMGAESREEFGEKFAPSGEYGELLGHTIYFYSKDLGKPVNFVPPAYALQDITEIPRFKSFNAQDYGCRLWWIEYGGRMDTIHQTEQIKWELWKVVYGVWNYIKNSGNFPEAENLTLEWVGTIPGKRESRRFEGEYMLKQQDIVEQKTFEDAVAYGGWSIDLHPADGVFSEKPGCNQWHSKGLYQIPFSCFYNKNLSNLFYAGRIISATHVAFGSTRVMGTCAHGGQAVGMAAALAVKNNWTLDKLVEPAQVKELQTALLRTAHHIPGVSLRDTFNQTLSARIHATSEYVLDKIPFDGPWVNLNFSAAQMLPVTQGRFPQITLKVNARKASVILAELRVSSKRDNYTPDVTVAQMSISVDEGEQNINLDFKSEIASSCYAFVCLMKNEDVEVKGSNLLVSGVLSVFNKVNKAVSNFGKQTPPEEIGVEAFEFWCPHRRPEGRNFGMVITPGIQLFSAQNISNGLFRPTTGPNAWVAKLEDEYPELVMEWNEKRTVNEITLAFDTDYDHPMESSLMGHPEATMPFCVKEYEILNDKGEVLHSAKDNHQTVNKIKFDKPVLTDKLIIKVRHPSENVPAAIFEVLIY